MDEARHDRLGPHHRPAPEELDTVAWELARDLYYLRNHSLLLDLRLLATSLLLLGVPAAWRR